ncbi:hypothetical protein [Streptomyces globisporus]|uniref:hypothetical protein n=1 Tax=Streptomyces globisporus TaxID=1908 RepID=UPI0004C5BC46|nr:hypothetical protein [Streptomyces globisporus]
MRTLNTDAERDEAVALVQDRQRWLTLRGLPVTAQADVPALFRDAQTRPAGLFEDGDLLACLTPRALPGLDWGKGPCLFLDHLHTRPDHPDDIIRLITLWASDCAARHDLPLVRAEMPARSALEAEPLAGRLRRFIDLGWDLRGAGPGREGDRAARLDLRAVHRPGLSALIDCRIEPHSCTGDDEE